MISTYCDPSSSEMSSNEASDTCIIRCDDIQLVGPPGGYVSCTKMSVSYDSYLLVGELQIDSKLVQGLQAFRNTAVLCASASHSGR